jgi:hypothetical protein
MKYLWTYKTPGRSSTKRLRFRTGPRPRTETSRGRLRKSAGAGLRHRLSAARSDGIRSASSPRATASSARTEASPATAADWRIKSRSSRMKASMSLAGFVLQVEEGFRED